MSEKPILFSGQMVRAILAGRKTQTRRVVDYSTGWVSGLNGYTYQGACPVHPHQHLMQCGASILRISCPYGQPGDRLWVRETWATYGMEALAPQYRPVFWAADREREGFSIPPDIKWRPSIHMPRWACRLRLEITGVRIERLDISEADAIAEGIEQIAKSDYPRDGKKRAAGPWWKHYQHEGACTDNPVFSYRTLWDSINGKPRPGKPDVSWSANPYVWVVTFKKLP
jgi:hypothetical protein